MKWVRRFDAARVGVVSRYAAPTTIKRQTLALDGFIFALIVNQYYFVNNVEVDLLVSNFQGLGSIIGRQNYYNLFVVDHSGIFFCKYNEILKGYNGKYLIDKKKL
jgi:hypothetical protein